MLYPTEEYRGYKIVTLRDDPDHRVVQLRHGRERDGNTYNTVAMARRAADHRIDRSCANHGGERACERARVEEARALGIPA